MGGLASAVASSIVSQHRSMCDSGSGERGERTKVCTAKRKRNSVGVAEGATSQQVNKRNKPHS